MNKASNANTLHSQHLKWNNELALFEDKIKTYENRLSEVSSKNTSTEIKKQVEHFQNQFIVNQSAIDGLKNDIQKHELSLKHLYENGINEIGGSDKDYHNLVVEKIETQRSIFNDLKDEFYSFVGKVL